ncbi:hypothetical protein HRK28_09015 [Rathayibacter sp. VKM Ac-2835]|uniref:hypothetical protein n=1 Tax=Rathayibacter sp. VKM Ac-2835 TaxID=2739043 RepID=UPI001564013E|nr:hypothetical protein [Rathayibacter sp. VKM Ac-2835]NRG41063.1 hypothetical protein [Rathayibacter sp. VKM Ac-2835]
MTDSRTAPPVRLTEETLAQREEREARASFQERIDGDSRLVLPLVAVICSVTAVLSFAGFRLLINAAAVLLS